VRTSKDLLARTGSHADVAGEYIREDDKEEIRGTVPWYGRAA